LIKEKAQELIHGTDSFLWRQLSLLSKKIPASYVVLKVQLRDYKSYSLFHPEDGGIYFFRNVSRLYDITPYHIPEDSKAVVVPVLN
jgi:hypothetical protein